jgi:putative tryptophan/tyrosine transport system substrate-binding protein
VTASKEIDLEPAFATLAQSRAEALLEVADPFLTSQRARLVALAAHHRIPATWQFREYVIAGGLMSYGASLADAYRRVGAYAARILKGDKPAELPIDRATKVELVLNSKTAKSFGIAFPLSLLGRADEVIE